jgi:hypothetical protein
LPAAPAPVVAQALPPPVSPAMPARRSEYALARRPLEPPPSLERRPLQERLAQPVGFAAGPPPEHWAIQVGAFANLATAQAAAETARAAEPGILRMAKIELPATTPFGSQVAFRARLSGLSPSAASDACARLGGRGMACITVPPQPGTF